MRKNIGIILGIVAVLSLALVLSCAPSDTGRSSYAEDRAQIEDLQARYLFALDFFDMDTYVSTFTEDGILDIVAYQVQGREEIRKKLEEARPVFDQSAVARPLGMTMIMGTAFPSAMRLSRIVLAPKDVQLFSLPPMPCIK